MYNNFVEDHKTHLDGHPYNAILTVHMRNEHLQFH